MDEELYVIEGDGRRRKAKELSCCYCNNRFIVRLSGKQKFCSKRCCQLAGRIRKTLKCYTCSVEFERTPSKINITKHDIHFCSRKCKDYGQSIAGGCKEIQPPSYGNGESTWRLRLIERSENPVCVGCLEDKPYLLVIHHIDGDRSNNVEDNLEVVCGSCHLKRHLKLVDGDWKYNSNCLTPRDELCNL